MDKLSEIELKEMFIILSNNLNKIDLNNSLMDSDYELWKSSIKKLEDFKVYLLKEDEKIIGFFFGIKKNNNCFLCEIQIDDVHKGDKKTFRVLMNKFIDLFEIDKDDYIYSNISIRNIKAREVFMSIGMVNFEDNKYRIKGYNLIEWLNK